MFLNSIKAPALCALVFIKLSISDPNTPNTQTPLPSGSSLHIIMEAAGGLIAEVGWTEFDFLSHCDESSELMEQLLGAFPSHGEEGQHELLPWSDQASNEYSDSIPPAYEGYCFLSNSCTAPADALGSSSVQQEHGAVEYLDVLANHSFNCHGNCDPSCEEDLDDPMGIPMVGSASATANKSKRKRKVEEHDGQTETRGRKCARNVGEAKRGKRGKKSGDEDSSSSLAVPNGSPTSCCTSDSDSNASLESADADADADARRPKGKGRASRGTTTEPQSIYARKRRERINERLKILQGLVPNGTKVDISTMLEEAVHYVKFLQLQIRLLSSDDTWMYAPIAYNGMNIGNDLSMDR